MSSQERVSLYMSPEMKEFFVQEAESAGISLSGYIGFVLKQYMEDKKDKEMIRRFEGLMEMFGGIDEKFDREEMRKGIDSISTIADFIKRDSTSSEAQQKLINGNSEG